MEVFLLSGSSICFISPPIFAGFELEICMVEIVERFFCYIRKWLVIERKNRSVFTLIELLYQSSFFFLFRYRVMITGAMTAPTPARNVHIPCTGVIQVVVKLLSFSASV